MGPVEYAAVIATILAGIAAVYATLFGSKPLIEVFSRWWASTRGGDHTNKTEETGEDKPQANDDLEFNSQHTWTIVVPDANSQEANMASETRLSTVGRAALRQNLIDYFSEEDLKKLSFDLGVDYEELPGGAKGAKAMELIKYFERRGCIADLVDKCSEERPNVSWEEAPQLKNEVTRQTARITLDNNIGDLDREVSKVKRLVQESQYMEAAKEAKEHRPTLLGPNQQSNPRFALSFAEFDVWYSHALMYIGETADALERLEDVIKRLEDLREHGPESRWHLVLGRAHNHIGYINWMDLGYYELALKQFRKAIHHCATARVLTGELNDELATAYDNMGRVYTEIGYRIRGELMVEHGREMRQHLPDIGRRTLSLNSRAIVHLAFGEPARARAVSERILDDLKSLDNKRAKGLALLTRGRALRYSASYAHSKDSNPEENRKNLDQAQADLQTAEDIFEEIDEWVRLFQVSNELGCTEREYARLLRRQGEEYDALAHANAAIEPLEKSIQIAKGTDPTKYAYPAHFMDACMDLVDTYDFLGDHKNVDFWLESAQAAAPSECLLGTRIATQSPQCSEDLWQQLGKMAFLQGHIAFNRSSDTASLDTAMKYYAQAAGYFGRFLSRPIDTDNRFLYPHYLPQLANHRIFIEQFYEQLRDLKPKQLHSIRQGIKISDLEREYGVQSSWLEDFFGDTLDLLLDRDIAED